MKPLSQNLCQLALTMFAVLSSLSAQAEEGGIVDSSGLVWGGTVYEITGGSFSTYDYAKNQIGSFVGSFDGSGFAYDDWRLPTINELLSAYSDGTLRQAMYEHDDGWPISTEIVLWSSETRGRSAYVVRCEVELHYNPDYDPTDPNSQELLGWDLVSAVTDLIRKDSSIEAVMVRDVAGSDDGGGDGNNGKGGTKGPKK